jgi:hypothetical protein
MIAYFMALQFLAVGLQNDQTDMLNYIILRNPLQQNSPGSVILFAECFPFCGGHSAPGCNYSWKEPSWIKIRQ